MLEHTPRILLVDDEQSIQTLLSFPLRKDGYEVVQATDGREALARFGETTFDLVVLDVMLPDVDGFAVQERLRSDGRGVPVLFLTARDSVEDRVRGLTLGGDDYLTKPFSIDELVARVRAILRRSQSGGTSGERLSYFDLEIDEETRDVRRGGRRIELSPTEYVLLRYLLVNARRIMSKAQILDHVWQYDFGGDGRIVETYISYLRKKVDADAVPLIQTVRRVGYVLRHPED